MGGYAEGNNHRTFYEENPDNSVITVPPRGYGNDVLKYIEEHKMVTQGKITEKTPCGQIYGTINQLLVAIGSRPKHKRQDQVQQLSYNHSRLES